MLVLKERGDMMVEGLNCAIKLINEEIEEAKGINGVMALGMVQVRDILQSELSRTDREQAMMDYNDDDKDFKTLYNKLLIMYADLEDEMTQSMAQDLLSDYIHGE